MNLSTKMTILLLMVSAALLAGCCNDSCTTADCSQCHHIDVYIAADCTFRTQAAQGWITELFLFKGDILVLNNTTTDPVELSLPVGVFDSDKVTVPGHERVMVTVIAEKEDPGSIGVPCGDGSGGPKVRIGQNP